MDAKILKRLKQLENISRKRDVFSSREYFKMMFDESIISESRYEELISTPPNDPKYPLDELTTDELRAIIKKLDSHDSA